MKIEMEAVVIFQEKKEITRFKNGVKEIIEGQSLEIKPENFPGKTLNAKVFNIKDKFEDYKKYRFQGELSFSTKGTITYINFEVLKSELAK